MDKVQMCQGRLLLQLRRFYKCDLKFSFLTENENLYILLHAYTEDRDPQSLRKWQNSLGVFVTTSKLEQVADTVVMKNRIQRDIRHEVDG